MHTTRHQGAVSKQCFTPFECQPHVHSQEKSLSSIGQVDCNFLPRGFFPCCHHQNHWNCYRSLSISTIPGEPSSMAGSVWWVYLSWMPQAHQAALSFPSSAGWGSGEKMKREKNYGSRWKQFNKAKANVVHGSNGREKKKQILFSASRQQSMSSHFSGSRASVCVAVALEEKRCNNDSTFSFSLLAFIAEQISYAMKYPFG